MFWLTACLKNLKLSQTSRCCSPEMATSIATATIISDPKYCFYLKLSTKHEELCVKS
jgi:hypothetical protein